MTYADLLSEEGITSQFLCIINPRRRVSTFSVYSGSVYSVSFDYGYVSSVEIDGSALTLAGSVSLSAGEYYFDFDTETLYVRASDSGNPNSKFSVVHYELFVSTFDAHWYRDPMDTASAEVYYKPLIKKSPQLKVTSGETWFGYMPIQTSEVTLINADHEFEYHVHDSSFNKAPIKIYHYLDELTVSNLKKVYDGLCGDLSFSFDELRIKCFNAIDELSKGYLQSDTSFYGVADFPNLDPNKVLYPIRYVYGRVDGFMPVNIDWVDPATSTTSDNRVYAVIGEQVNLANISKTVPASPSSTTTRTYLNSAQGLMVGDSVHFDRAVGTDEYHEITVVDYGSNYIEHAALATPMASGDAVKRSFVGQIRVIQDGVVYRPQFGRDYSTSGALAVNTAGFTFTNNFEATLSMPNPHTSNDVIMCRVYGRTNDVTLNAIAYGSNDSQSGNLANPFVVIVDLLKRSAGISESKIDITGFTTEISNRTDAVGFAIPDTATGGFKNIKEYIIDILKTSLIKFYINDDLKFSVKAIEPTGSETKTIEDDEILVGSIDSDYSYSDLIAIAKVEYNKRELSENPNQQGGFVSIAGQASNIAQFLHKVTKQETFPSLHFKESDAQKLADRLSYVLGDRIGTLTFRTKNRFFDTDIQDVIKVQRDKLGGYQFVDDTLQSRNYVVDETQKSLFEISIKTNDNKGIDDNTANW